MAAHSNTLPVKPLFVLQVVLLLPRTVKKIQREEGVGRTLSIAVAQMVQSRARTGHPQDPALPSSLQTTSG